MLEYCPPNTGKHLTFIEAEMGDRETNQTYRQYSGRSQDRHNFPNDTANCASTVNTGDMVDVSVSMNEDKEKESINKNIDAAGLSTQLDRCISLENRTGLYTIWEENEDVEEETGGELSDIRRGDGCTMMDVCHWSRRFGAMQVVVVWQPQWYIVIWGHGGLSSIQARDSINANVSNSLSSAGDVQEFRIPNTSTVGRISICPNDHLILGSTANSVVALDMSVGRDDDNDQFYLNNNIILIFSSMEALVFNVVEAYHGNAIPKDNKRNMYEPKHNTFKIIPESSDKSTVVDSADSVKTGPSKTLLSSQRKKEKEQRELQDRSRSRKTDWQKLTLKLCLLRAMEVKRLCYEAKMQEDHQLDQAMLPRTTPLPQHPVPSQQQPPASPQCCAAPHLSQTPRADSYQPEAPSPAGGGRFTLLGRQIVSSQIATYGYSQTKPEEEGVAKAA
ncbi:hypothetical protein EV421DRAFT_1739266 [Armillaria borealis]|uniref:Uncharacterized protein n=1 Tax=Armillaria borealis TaxID=47425 RepID=A0AA39MJE4_9AGAR|nr:hypothetical protein EV421DRAFT_1739266 [Armillaria borealis]